MRGFGQEDIHAGDAKGVHETDKWLGIFLMLRYQTDAIATKQSEKKRDGIKVFSVEKQYGQRGAERRHLSYGKIGENDAPPDYLQAEIGMDPEQDY